jgi:nucleoside-diphosphate-sugar epimerase
VNVLVTGGAGFIGSAIARALLDGGWRVRVLDNFSTGFESSIPEGVELITGDLRDPETVRRACQGMEVVFHEGAIRSVARSVDDPVLAHDCNVGGTLNLLMAAEAMGVRRVVYASSSSVYGDREDLVNQEAMLPEPLSPYAASKLAGELYCRVWTRLKGLSTVSLRYFNVFGPGQHPQSKYSAVFPAFISALTAGRRPEIHWDGEQSRDFTYIDDVVRANVLAAQADERVDGAVVNIGGSRPKTVNEVLASVADAVGRWIEPLRLPKRPGDVRRTFADITPARELLGWSPEAVWDVAVSHTVAWFLSGSRPAPGHEGRERARS